MAERTKRARKEEREGDVGKQKVVAACQLFATGALRSSFADGVGHVLDDLVCERFALQPQDLVDIGHEERAAFAWVHLLFERKHPQRDDRLLSLVPDSNKGGCAGRRVSYGSGSLLQPKRTPKAPTSSRGHSLSPVADFFCRGDRGFRLLAVVLGAAGDEDVGLVHHLVHVRLDVACV